MSLQNWRIYQACTTVLYGGIIAYPTEAVFGLGCLPTYEAAVNRIKTLKHRSPTKKGIIIVASSIKQILSFIDIKGIDDMDVIFDSWPGPVTWVFPASKSVPSWLQGKDNTIALRVSENIVIQSLCDRLGPIISTSANYEGRKPARNSRQVRNYFFNNLDYIYPGNIATNRMPTEIRDAKSGEVLRKTTPNQ